MRALEKRNPDALLMTLQTSMAPVELNEENSQKLKNESSVKSSSTILWHRLTRLSVKLYR